MILEEKDYLSKIALSKENEKLGTIVRVEGSPTAVIISEKLHAIVKVSRLIFSPDFIHLPLDSVIEKTEENVQFSISEDDFQLMKKAYRADRKNRVKLDKMRKNVDEDYNKNIDNAQARQIRRW
jgi:hypothetical protein